MYVYVCVCTLPLSLSVCLSLSLSLSHAHIHTDLRKITDTNFLKLFRLCQLIIEYQLHVQVWFVYDA